MGHSKWFFALSETEPTSTTRVIIVRDGGVELGILADAIVGVRSIPLKGIQPSLPTLTEVRAEFLKGITREQLAVLDVAGLLSSERIVVHEEAD